MEHEPKDHDKEGETGPEQAPKPEPRIYVASLSDYTAGHLHGEWLSAGVSTEELESGVQSMLASSPTQDAEEFGIFDYEGFGPFRLSEYESLSTVSTIALGIANHGAAFSHWAAMVGTTDPEALDEFEDNYRGHWESVESFAEEFLDGLGANHYIEEGIPEFLQHYVKLDVESFTRDLETSGQVSVSHGDNGVYVFEGQI